MVSENVALRPGERVITEAKLSLGAVIVPAVLLVLGLVVLIFDISPAINSFRPLGILVAVIGAWGTITALITRLTTKFTMTDERLIGESGWRPHKKMAIEIRNLDSVASKGSLLGSLLGYGTLIVNARGQGNLNVAYPQVPGAAKIAEQIRAQMAAPAKARL